MTTHDGAHRRRGSTPRRPRQPTNERRGLLRGPFFFPAGAGPRRRRPAACPHPDRARDRRAEPRCCRRRARRPVHPGRGRSPPPSRSDRAVRTRRGARRRDRRGLLPRRHPPATSATVGPHRGAGRRHRPGSRPRRRRPLHRTDGPRRPRGRHRARPAPGRAARGARGPGPSRAAHPGRLRREEPPDEGRRGRPGAPPGGRRRRRRDRDLGRGRVNDLLSIDDLGADGIDELLTLSESFVEVTQRDIPKIPALRGKTIVTLFYEDSTRTRLSFETAAKRLSADTMSFTAASSAVGKGESLLDTVRTIEAMGVDTMVVRHRCAGAPHRIASWIDAAVVNAGDGRHEHPTQALLDLLTLRRRLGTDAFRGLRVGIVGDVRHSRVARSGVKAFAAVGADVTVVGPPTLLPESLEGWPARATTDLDDALPELDVVYLLRIQRERLGSALLPSLREYTSRYGLTAERAARLKPDTVIMHPGPMNRGIEIAAEVADGPASIITEQVANGVAVRMAVLWSLLGSGAPVA